MDFLSKRVLVVGAEGSGKSSLLSQLAKCNLSTKTNMLAESITKCAIKAKFMGRACEIEMLETNGDWMHYLHSCSAIIITFDILNRKSQKESTVTLGNIRRYLADDKTEIPIMLVFTKCDTGPISEAFNNDPNHPLYSTSTKTRLGVDELKLEMFRATFPELRRHTMVEKFCQAVKIATESTISSIDDAMFTFSKLTNDDMQCGGLERGNGIRRRANSYGQKSPRFNLSRSASSC